jgi:recombination associated protein RdgC
VSFVLTDQMVLKKIEFLDGVYEGHPPGNHRDADEAFDADAAIATGELIRLIPDLLDALGGEQQPGMFAPTEPVTTAPSVPVGPAPSAPAGSQPPPWE